MPEGQVKLDFGAVQIHFPFKIPKERLTAYWVTKS